MTDDELDEKRDVLRFKLHARASGGTERGFQAQPYRRAELLESDMVAISVEDGGATVAAVDYVVADAADGSSGRPAHARYATMRHHAGHLSPLSPGPEAVYQVCCIAAVTRRYLRAAVGPALAAWWALASARVAATG